MSCQKVINVIAVASGVVSIAIVSSGLFVFVNRDSIIDNVKQQAIDAALGSLGGLGGGSLPLGTNDLAPTGGDPSISGVPSPAAPQGIPGL
tara:strand:+ start:372 stop:644 length:273 start_codon:yes stop_codon:yes gene_type:complete